MTEKCIKNFLENLKLSDIITPAHDNVESKTFKTT